MTSILRRRKASDANPRKLRMVVAAMSTFLLVTPLPNVALAKDARAVADTHLRDYIPAIQSTMVSMSASCPGGEHGVAPASWPALAPHGDNAVNEFQNARVSLAKNEGKNAKNHIEAGLNELATMVNGLHNSCPGGCCGVDPDSFGSYMNFANLLTSELRRDEDYLDD